MIAESEPRAPKGLRARAAVPVGDVRVEVGIPRERERGPNEYSTCLLYTSDAADE